MLLDELGAYRPELLDRPRLVVGTKADVVRPTSSDFAGRRRRGFVISAVTRRRRAPARRGDGAARPRGPPGGAGPRRLRHAAPGAERRRVERLGDARVPGHRPRRRARRRAQRRHDPEALAYIDHRFERLGVSSCWPGPAPTKATSCGSATSASSTAESDVRAVVVKIGTSSITDERGASTTRRSPSSARGRRAARTPGTRCSSCPPVRSRPAWPPSGSTSRPTDIGDAAGARGRRPAPADAQLGRRRSAHHGLVAAQVLLVPHDFVDRRQYLHARRTLTRLLELGCVPIVNENDAIAVDEIRYGDNDRIAALVAAQHRRRPAGAAHRHRRAVHRRPAARRRRPASIERDAGRRPAALDHAPARAAAGGGAAAWRASSPRRGSRRGRACRAVIADALDPGVLADAVAGEPVGTTFDAARPQAVGAQALDRVRRPRRPARSSSTTGPGGHSSSARRPAAGRRGRRAGAFDEGDTVDVAAPTASRSRAAWCSSTPASCARVAGRPRATCRRRRPRSRPPRRPRPPAADASATVSGRRSSPGVISLGRRPVGQRLFGGLRLGRRGLGRRPRRLEAELGAQFAEAALGLDVGGGLLDLQDA